MPINETAQLSDRISELLNEARTDFCYEAYSWENSDEDLHDCTRCTAKNVRTAQSWNDVGGASTMMCEACYIHGIVVFWLSEDEASDV